MPLARLGCLTLPAFRVGLCLFDVGVQGQITMLGGWMDRILSAEDWARMSKQRAHGSRWAGGTVLGCLLPACFLLACVRYLHQGSRVWSMPLVMLRPALF
jgi:hypothetical protein